MAIPKSLLQQMHLQGAFGGDPGDFTNWRIQNDPAYTKYRDPSKIREGNVGGWKPAPAGMTAQQVVQDVLKTQGPQAGWSSIATMMNQGYFNDMPGWDRKFANQLGQQVAQMQDQLYSKDLGGTGITMDDVMMGGMVAAPLAGMYATGSGVFAPAAEGAGAVAAGEAAAAGGTGYSVPANSSVAAQMGWGGAGGAMSSTPALTYGGGAAGVLSGGSTAVGAGLGAGIGVGTGLGGAGEIANATLNPEFSMNYTGGVDMAPPNGWEQVAPPSTTAPSMQPGGETYFNQDFSQGQGGTFNHSNDYMGGNFNQPAYNYGPSSIFTADNVKTALQGAGSLLSLSSAEDMEDALHAQLQPGEPGYDYSQNWDLVEEYLRNPMKVLEKNPGYLASVDFLEKQGRRQMAAQGYTGSGNLNYYLADTLGKNANSWFNQAWQPIRDAAGLARPDQTAALGNVGVAAQNQIHNAKQNALGDLFNVGAKGIDAIYKNWTW